MFIISGILNLCLPGFGLTKKADLSFKQVFHDTQVHLHHESWNRMAIPLIVHSHDPLQVISFVFALYKKCIKELII